MMCGIIVDSQQVVGDDVWNYCWQPESCKWWCVELLWTVRYLYRTDLLTTAATDSKERALENGPGSCPWPGSCDKEHKFVWLYNLCVKYRSHAGCWIVGSLVPWKTGLHPYLSCWNYPWFSSQGRQERPTEFWWTKPSENSQLEDRELDGSVMLRYSLW